MRRMSVRCEPPPQLRHDAVDRRQVGGRSARKRTIEVTERARWRQGLSPLDLGALELPPQDRLEAAQGVARDAIAARIVGRQVGLGLGAQAERATDALDVDADHARALLAPAEGGDRHPCEVAHRSLRAIPQRGRDLRAQGLQVFHGELVEVDRARRGL